MPQENALKSILIVEDSRLQRTVLKNILERAGYQVIEAEDGIEGVKQAKECSPSLILSDINMPRMDGLELCQILKEHPILSSIPVLLVTVLSDPLEVISGLNVGAYGYITKPYSEQFLLEKVKKSILLKAQDFLIEKDNGVAYTFKGQQHLLVASRSQILEFLLSVYGSAIQQNKELSQAQAEQKKLNCELEKKVAALNIAEAELQKYSSKLEKTVEERTKKIRTILDHVQFGFLICDADGLILPGYTKSCREIFDQENLEGAAFGELLNLNNKDLGTYGMMLFQAMDQDCLIPPEEFLDQMPCEFQLGEKVYYFKGTVLPNNQDEERTIMFTIADITNQALAKRESLCNYNLVQILRFRDGFLAFLHEIKMVLIRCRDNLIKDAQAAVRIDLHSIKGSVGCYGFYDLASYIHSVEDQQLIQLTHIDQIEQQISDYLRDNFDALGIHWNKVEQRDISLPAASLQEFKASAAQCNQMDSLKRLVSQFIKEASFVAAETLLNPYHLLVKQLADRHGKPVELLLKGGGIHVDEQLLGPVFTNIAHLIRNSMDHGIEEPMERGEKNALGNITIDFTEKNSGWEIKYQDDGQGIDPDRISRIAVEKGVLDPSRMKDLSEKECLALIFHPGFSTRDEASLTSGRGVGMCGFKQAIENVGGMIETKTVLGQGTTFIATIPYPA